MDSFKHIPLSEDVQSCSEHLPFEALPNFALLFFEGTTVYIDAVSHGKQIVSEEQEPRETETCLVNGSQC